MKIPSELKEYAMDSYIMAQDFYILDYDYWVEPIVKTFNYACDSLAYSMKRATAKEVEIVEKILAKLSYEASNINFMSK